MMKKIFNNKKYIAIVIIFGIVLIAGITYATINWTSENYNIAVKSSCMSINYTKGQDFSGNIGIINESSYVSNNTVTVNSGMFFSSVSIELDENCTDVAGFATIEFNISSISDSLKQSGKFFGALKYVIVEYDPNDYNELTMSELSGKSFNLLGRGIIYNTGVMDAYTGYIEPGGEKNYLIFFYADSLVIGNEIITSAVQGTIGARVEQAVPTLIHDFEYEIGTGDRAGYVILKRYIGSRSDVVVPSTYTIDNTTYNVGLYTYFNTSNYQYSGVFVRNTSITSVYLSPSVKPFYGASGGDYDMTYMFSGCTNLRKVPIIPDLVTNMTSTFSGCTSLVNAPVIPSSVTNMNGTFSGCTSLVNAPIIPNSVQNMSSTFNNCTSLVNAPTIGNSVESLYNTFYGCTSLVNAPIIPNSVTDMSYTFRNCTSLVNAPPLGNSVTNMSYTFAGCTNVKTAPVIPNSVTNMNSTFNGCTSLVSAPIIPNSVINMNYTFSGCTSLINAPAIPDSVSYMSNTFRNCTSLVNAPTLGNSVTNMSSTFSGCTSLVNAPTLGNSVQDMSSTFSGCTSLVNVPIIPDSVTNMSYTFENCTSLSSTIMTIPSLVTNMTGTFSGCTKLSGTIRINSTNVSYSNSSNYYPFYGTSKSIIVQVPSGSTTYTNMSKSSYKPRNVTISTFSS